MTCGIYCIECLINKYKYIGQSLKIEGRFDQHIYYLNNGIHINKYFQNAWNKYGEENFKFYIIEECSEKDLNKREDFYIKEWNTKYPNGYNRIDGGNFQRKKCDSSSKYLGVCKNGNKFRSQIPTGYDFLSGYIGDYDEEEWAAMAYDYVDFTIIWRKM